MSTEDKRERLRALREEALHAGTEAAVERQHARGKQTARERIDMLLDPGSFTELGMFTRHRAHGFGLEDNRPWGDGVVTGHGTIEGRNVFVFSQDFTVFGGSLGEVFAEKIVKVMDLAVRMGCPIVGINDSGGARIQEGVVSLGGYADIFFRNVRASGVIPQISVVMGPCAGGAVYSPAITDFIFMVRETSHMFITGPEVIKTVTGEDVTMEELGGAQTHATRSGVAHFAADSEQECLEMVRELLSFLPQNNLDPPPFAPTADPRDRVVRGAGDDRAGPADQAVRHDPRDRAGGGRRRLPRGRAALRAEHRRGLRAPGRARRRRRRQPAQGPGRRPRHRRVRSRRRASCASATPSASRWSRSSTSPASCPGTTQEYGGIILHGAKLLYAYAEATVPKLTVITRKAYGGAYDVMSSKHVGADFNAAWPTAEVAVMGPEGAVNIVFRRELAEAERNGDDAAARREQLIEDYKERFANPYIAAERGYVDDVIEPEETRAWLDPGARDLADQARGAALAASTGTSRCEA